ncbi:MAG: ABC transporter permease [Thermoguttaceae bacterium]
MNPTSGACLPSSADARGALAVHWSVIAALVYRELKSRYARSRLGWAWIVLQPAMQMVVFTLLRSVLGLADSGGMHVVIFLYSALLPWNFVVNAINNSAPSIFSNAPLIKKTAVAREVFPLAAVLASLADFVVGLAILAGLMVWFAAPLTWNLLWVPVLAAVAVVLSVGIGLLVAAAAPFRGEVRLAIPHLTQLWMFLTPLFYSVDQAPAGLRRLLVLNPAAGLVQAFRNVIGAGAPPELGPLAWAAAFSLMLLAFSWPVFRHMSQYFADMM